MAIPRHFPGLLLAILLGGGVALQAAAQTLYGTIGAGGTGSTLVELDPDTGALISTIGSVGYGVNGMAWDVTTGTLYATTRQGDPDCPRGLLTIDTSTGAGTPVGCGHIVFSGQGPALLTANSAGQLYSWLEASADDLILWDKAVGTYSAPIGDSGLNTGEHTLAFDNGDVLYVMQVDELYTINVATGASTFLGTVAGAGSTHHHGAFNPASNLLYTIDRSGNGNNPRNLVLVDVDSRTVVDTLPTADDLHVIAFGGERRAPQAIPTFPLWSLMATTALLGLFGLLAARRRRA